MKSFFIPAVLCLLCCLPLLSLGQKAKDRMIKELEKEKGKYTRIATSIWQYAEVGYQEEKSSALLQSTLKEEGFEIKAGVAGMPTAFIASYGSGSPVIAVLAEFDALPGLSQDTMPTRSKIEGKVSGHACGHHLFGTASVAAAITTKNWMQKNKIAGTLRLYGTPAEEGGAGKVYLVRDGFFKDVDATIHWHPADRNLANPGSSLANKSAKFRFYGKSAHAAGAPHKGRSALDGVEAMNDMVNMLREHVPMETRIHYVITRGGDAPNIVPEFAEVYYYIRHPDVETDRQIFERVVKCAEGAALGTETRMEYEVIHGLYNLLPNVTLSRLMHKNLSQVGGFTYTEKEVAFAETIRTTLGDKLPEISSTEKVLPFENAVRKGAGSTDVGDVSWVTPTAGLRAATWVPGTPAHSWQAVACGGMSIGMKGMMVAAKTLALTAHDLFTDAEVLVKAQQELKEQAGPDFTYKALLGDRPPALDYRK